MNEFFCFLLEHPLLRPIVELAFLLGAAFLWRFFREGRLTSLKEEVLYEMETCTPEMQQKELLGRAAIIACIFCVVQRLGNYPYWMEFGIWGIDFIVVTWILNRNSARNQFAVSEDAIALLEDIYLFLRKQLGERDGKKVLHFICSLLEEHKIKDFVVSISYERKGSPEERREERRKEGIAVAHITLIDMLHTEMEIHIFPKENRDFYILISG